MELELELKCKLCAKSIRAATQCNGCKAKFHLKCLKRHLLYRPTCIECGRFNFVHLPRKQFSAEEILTHYPLRVFFATPFECVLLNARRKLSWYPLDLAKLVNRDGDTLLHVACCYDHIEIVKLLLSGKIGLSPYVANSALDFPIHVAARMGNIEIVKLFHQMFPHSVYLLNCRGELPLHVAVLADHPQLALVLAGSMNPCKLDTMNENEESALALALSMPNRNDFSELIAYLIGAGCDAGLQLVV